MILNPVYLLGLGGKKTRTHFGNNILMCNYNNFQLSNQYVIKHLLEVFFYNFLQLYLI